MQAESRFDWIVRLRLNNDVDIYAMMRIVLCDCDVLNGMDG